MECGSIVKNINPKLKMYGKTAVVIQTFKDCTSYVKYFEGRTVYIKNSNLSVIKGPYKVGERASYKGQKVTIIGFNKWTGMYTYQTTNGARFLASPIEFANRVKII